MLCYRSLKFQTRLAGGYTTSGISKDCKYTYFYNEQRISVHKLSTSLGSANGKAEQPSIEIYSYTEEGEGSVIERVTSSGDWLAVSTNEELLILDMTSHSNQATPIYRRPHGEWEPTGLALHGEDAKLSVVIGQRKQGRDHFEGRVLAFFIVLPVHTGSAISETCKYEYDLPQKDFPKDVAVNGDGTLFLCLTHIHNNVIIWESSSRPSSGNRVLRIIKSYYTPVSVQLSRKCERKELC